MCLLVVETRVCENTRDVVRALLCLVVHLRRCCACLMLGGAPEACLVMRNVVNMPRKNPTPHIDYSAWWWGYEYEYGGTCDELADSCLSLWNLVSVNTRARPPPPPFSMPEPGPVQDASTPLHAPLSADVLPLAAAPPAAHVESASARESAVSG